MNNTEYQRPILYVLLFIGTIILGAVLKTTASVFLPIVAMFSGVGIFAIGGQLREAWT